MNIRPTIRFFAVLFSFALFSTCGLAENIELPTWLLHTKFSGDFRYRHETIDFNELSGDSTRAFTRHRHRLRLRLGMISSPSDYTTVGFRLASGSTSARSTNDDLSGGFSSKDFMLDRAYLDLHPKKFMKFILGKADVPFKRTSQLVWDSDVNIEGITSMLMHSCGTTEASLVMGGYWLQEYKRDDDQGLLGVQGNISSKSESIEWTASIAYLDYQKATRGAVFGSASGNTQIAQGTDGTLLPYYEHDYDLLTFSGIATVPVADKIKFSLYFEAVENTAIGLDRNGILGGFRLASKRGSLPYSAGYSYRDVEADATIAALMDSDFADGNSASEGHEISLSVSPLKELSFGATAIISEYTFLTRNLDFNRFMADAVVKF
ncbi:putative porin [bacterium]|nr:putative porin [bacterium]